ncbi:hypothetical protein JCM11251_004986 [Rhodosporidiobolus azoricus]
MSSAENRTELCPSLSLSPSAASFDFSKPFTLVSADGHSFSADPLKLAGTSSVFADMFSSGGGDRTCTLSEEKKEIEAYVAAVEMGTCPTEEAEWMSLFKMAQKYDSEMVRGVLLKGACLRVTDSPAEAFIAASLLKNQALMKEVALRGMIQAFDDTKDGSNAPNDDTDDSSQTDVEELAGHKLISLFLFYQVSQQRLLLDSKPPLCSKPRQSKNLDKIWLKAIHAAMQNVELKVGPTRALRQQLDRLDYGGLRTPYQLLEVSS